MLEDALKNAYLKIIEKHNNPIWAREELEWFVYDKHGDAYNYLSDSDKQTIDGYFQSLKKIHGGN